MPKAPLLFPFKAHSNEMVSYCMRGGSDQYVMKTLEEARFRGTLTYKTYERGRSSALLVFTCPKGRRHAFFMTDADDIIPHLVNGKIKGTFVPTKRGANYGWKLEKHDA